MAIENKVTYRKCNDEKVSNVIEDSLARNFIQRSKFRIFYNF